MGTTKNYGWTTTEQTDKIDVPTSINTPVEQIDASLKTVENKADAASTAATEAGSKADAASEAASAASTAASEASSKADAASEAAAAKQDALTAGRDISIADNVVALALNATNGNGENALVGNADSTDAASRASGVGATAIGENTTASGDYSHAEGYQTQATGEASHAEGYVYNKTTATASATGAYSHSEGRDTKASGTASHAEGYDNTASGNHSHAEGGFTMAIGEGAHAEGYNTNAYAFESHAEGASTTTGISGNGNQGYAGHAEGYDTKAVGNYSHAEGCKTETTSSGNYQHAEGYNTAAIYDAAHAEGRDTQATGSYSHAQGYGTIANLNSQSVLGKFNILQSYVADTGYDHKKDYAEIVGNGTDADNRSNARTLDWYGTEWLQNDVRCGGTDMEAATYSLSTLGATVATIPSTEYGYTDVLTVPAGSGVAATITFGSEKAEAPNMQCSVQDKGETMHKLTCCIGAVTTTTASVTVWNDSDTDTTAVVDWLAISGR